nr:DNA helicase [Tanacetum cinerariifolium]
MPDEATAKTILPCARSELITVFHGKVFPYLAEIPPNTIVFPPDKRLGASIRSLSVLSKCSCGHTLYVDTEVVSAIDKPTTTDGRKRMAACPLLTTRVEEPSSSRNIRRRFTLNASRTQHATESRNYQIGNNQNLRSMSLQTKVMSFGAKFDESVNKGKGHYVFKISSHIYHWIGSLCLEEGHHLCFLQLYVYDTRNEVSNIRQTLCRLDESTLNPEIVQGLIHVLDEHNGFVRLFRTARDRYNAGEIPAFKIRLYSMDGVRGTARDRYNAGEIPAFKIRLYSMDGVRGYELPTVDIIGGIVFENRPRNLTLKPQSDEGRGKKVMMNAYYKYQLHPRLKEFGLIFKSGRLFQQGDHEGIVAGSKIMLPNTFIGGTWYMYSHYLDALYPELTPTDRADIVCRDFKQKLYTVVGDSKIELQDAKRIDKFISTEIHDPVQDPRGYKLVTELMMHGPYGLDRILAKISNSEETASVPGNSKQIDEIQNYVDGQFICPYEACWRIFDFPIHSREPVVKILNVHLENMQCVNFHEKDRLDVIVNLPDKKKIILTEWFVYNNENTNAKHLTYLNFPSEFVSDLTTEKRQRSEAFAKWLLDVGNGEIGEPDKEDGHDSSWIAIPHNYLVAADERGLSQLIKFIYDDIILKTPTAGCLQEKAIVCLKNKTVDVVNAKMLSNINGESRTHLSNNEAIPMGKETIETELLYPMEYLNTITFPGFPPHELELKVGSPIMLLRNVNLSGGLCNGTRMILKSLKSKLIEAQIIRQKSR